VKVASMKALRDLLAWHEQHFGFRQIPVAVAALGFGAWTLPLASFPAIFGLEHLL